MLVEFTWIALGIITAVQVFLLGMAIERRGKAVHLAGSPRSDFVTREEMDSLRLFVDEAVDKIEHLYDRIRKRRLVEEPPKASNGPPVDSKAELRLRALPMLFPGRGMPVERPS